MNNHLNVTLRNLLSIAIGVVFALGIMFPFGYFSIFMTFSFGKISLETKILSYVVLISGFIMGAFFGGYITARKSMNNKNLNLFLFVFILIIILSQIGAFSIVDFDLEIILNPVIIAIAAFLGRTKEVPV